MPFQHIDTIAAAAAPQWGYQHSVAVVADKHSPSVPLAQAFRQHEQYAPLEAGFAAPRPMEDDEASVSSEWADEAPFDWEANHPATHGARSSLFDDLDVAGKKGQTFVLPPPAMPAARNIMDYAPDCKAPAPSPVEVFCHEPYAPLSFADSCPSSPSLAPSCPPPSEASLGFSMSSAQLSASGRVSPYPEVVQHRSAPSQHQDAPDAYTQAMSFALDPAAPFNHNRRQMRATSRASTPPPQPLMPLAAAHTLAPVRPFEHGQRLAAPAAGFVLTQATNGMQFEEPVVQQKRPKRGCRGGRAVQQRKQRALQFAAQEGAQ